MTGSAGLSLRPAYNCRWDLVSLGEVMLRFDPGEERLTTTRNFRVWEGGGEYNVARGLRRCFGLRTSIVTALADNPVGRLLEDLMLQGGVDLSHLRWVEYDGIGREARNGVYFLERGFGVRGAMGMMDRGHTPVSQLKPGQVDWDTIFAGEGTRWFHTGGVMCALSEDTPAVAREAMMAAKRHGVIVSYDCNYRASLWKSAGGRAGSCAMNRSLAPYVDVLFGHEGDLLAECEASQGPPAYDLQSFQAMGQRVAAEFPNIKVIAMTRRRPKKANLNDWTAFGFAEGQAFAGIDFPDLEIFDRVGGGDSFAAGVIYGLMQNEGLMQSEGLTQSERLKIALDCGVAHGALAMTTPGDSSMASLAEVKKAMLQDGALTVR